MTEYASDAEFQFQFPTETLDRLRELLGKPALDLALPGLMMGAYLYAHAREAGTREQKAARELLRIEKTLLAVEALNARLSVETIGLLDRAYDRNVALAGGPFVNAHQTLSDAVVACEQARVLVKIAQKPPPNAPSTLLTHGVANGLARTRQQLSKSRDGMFASVLTEVWYAVDRDGVPDDILPFVREAANFLRDHDRTLTPTKGRPRRRKNR